MSVSDQLLMAYADGELSPEQRAALEAAMAADSDLAARLQPHLRLRDIVSAAFAGVAEEPVPERLLLAASTVAPSNVVRPVWKPAAPAPRWWAVSGGLIAASLALGIFVGPALRTISDAPLIGGDMAAKGELAQALNTQLASSQGAAPVRIGLTFRSGDGAVCRTFQVERQAGIAGLACHEAAGWRVRMAVPSAGHANPTDYRTASSSLPGPVAALAQSLAVSTPLDAKAELEARSRHWSAYQPN